MNDMFVVMGLVIGGLMASIAATAFCTCISQNKDSENLEELSFKADIKSVKKSVEKSS